jgi:type VI secretion system protein ImpA
MPSAPVFNLDALLAPIAGENPSGENLQYSGLHDEIREARRADDDAEQGDWVRELKVADWEKVAELAGESLAGKTKDLQIVAWLSEAAVNMNGFPGLRDSLKVANGFLETFWETLYPEIDEGDDLEARGNALAWMDRQAADAARKIPLTKRPGANYSFFQWEEALQYDFPSDTSKLSPEALRQIEEKRARAQVDGKITGEEIRKARSETRRAFYEELYADVAESWVALQALDKQMDARFTRQTPGLGSLTKTLEGIRSALEKVVKEKRIEEPDPSDAAEGAEGETPGSAAAGPGGPIRAREQALAQLAQVADYFRRTEPHSPVSYLVQRAITWGQMPLDAWLGDVIKDNNVLAGLRETLGLKGGESGSTGG